MNVAHCMFNSNQCCDCGTDISARTAMWPADPIMAICAQCAAVRRAERLAAGTAKHTTQPGKKLSPDDTCDRETVIDTVIVQTLTGRELDYQFADMAMEFTRTEANFSMPSYTSWKGARKTKRHNFSDKMKAAILARDDYKCTYCGNLAGAVDHVVPASKGGPAIRQNGVAACYRCNGRKRARVNAELQTIGFYHLLDVGESLAWLDEARLDND